MIFRYYWWVASSIWTETENDGWWWRNDIGLVNRNNNDGQLSDSTRSHPTFHENAWILMPYFSSWDMLLSQDRTSTPNMTLSQTTKRMIWGQPVSHNTGFRMDVKRKIWRNFSRVTGSWAWRFGKFINVHSKPVETAGPIDELGCRFQPRKISNKSRSMKWPRIGRRRHSLDWF
jgi:hypothetical protein